MGDRHQFRANWHAYDYGVYFITICCDDKKHYFGEIKNNIMSLYPAGEVTKYHINQLHIHFTGIEVWNYVIMPNHIHILLYIPSTTHTPPDKINMGCLKPSKHNAPDNQDFHFNSPLSVILRGFKGGVTRDANRLGISFKWQARYHDHLIRNQRSYENIMNYIDNNIENWRYDCFNPTPQPRKNNTI